MINKNIQRIRKFIGISQRELGRRINMTGQYIAKIEKNDKTPPFDTIEKISKALDVEIFEILTRPKLLVELYLDVIFKKNLSIQDIISNTGFNIPTIESIFCDYIDGSYCVNDNISLGKYLGFSKSFCEKRHTFDCITKSNMPNSDLEHLMEYTNSRVSSWINSTKKSNPGYEPLSNISTISDETKKEIDTILVNSFLDFTTCMGLNDFKELPRKNILNIVNSKALTEVLISLLEKERLKLFITLNKVNKLPKKEKQIWEEEGKEYLMPIASHDKDGEFTEEDYKHDDDIMTNDEFWK